MPETPFPGCVCPPGYVRDTINGHPDTECPFYGIFGLELAKAHADALDPSGTAAHDQLIRECRSVIAYGERLLRTEETAIPRLEGARVELLSARDKAPTDALRSKLAQTAYRVELRKRELTGTVEPAAAVEPEPSPLDALADFDARPDACSCSRCGQRFIPHAGSTRCTSCDDADRDQGSQLGMFDVAPAPREHARADDLALF